VQADLSDLSFVHVELHEVAIDPKSELVVTPWDGTQFLQRGPQFLLISITMNRTVRYLSKPAFEYGRRDQCSRHRYLDSHMQT